MEANKKNNKESKKDFVFIRKNADNRVLCIEEYDLLHFVNLSFFQNKPGTWLKIVCYITLQHLNLKKAEIL